LPVWSSLGLLLTLTLLSWFGSRNKLAVPTFPLSARERAHLLRRLRVRYEQALAQSLEGAVQVELELASRPAAVQNAISLSLRLPEQPDQMLPPPTSIVEAYELSQQELLILGEPGAGKSTLLVELAHWLVEQAEQDETQPLPILLPLSTWAVRHLPLDEWLSEELANAYQVSHKLGRALVESDRILPLLDGLDEVAAKDRSGCVTAINTYHRERLQSLVVCSRTTEYEAAATRERLALHTAVVVQPLSREQVDTHLTSMGKPLAALRAALRKNTVLRELATTPLMLQVLMLTYYGTSVRELSHKEAQLREQIWADYVQRMVSRKGDIKRYPLPITITWLSLLARQMRQHNQTTFYLERLQPDWLPKRQRAFYRLSTGLFFGLIWGLSWGLVGWLLGGLFFGLIWGLSWGLVGGLFYGLIGDPGSWLSLWIGGGPWFGLLLGLLGGSLFGLLGGLFFGLLGGPVGGLIFGLSVGQFVAVSAMLSVGLSNRFLSELLMGIPIKRKRLDLFFKPILALFYGLIFGLIFGLRVGLIFGLIAAVSVVLPDELAAAVQHYILRFWLSCTHTFPGNVMPFLNDATARVLLRRVDGGYSFIHRLLLDHFADLEQDAT
ncbi:MAG TPA: NACHT domain-containing protein, partial [Ktedonobacteraceae bacterium]|nr:NACHT domain-containing protein [Ktedonobacteraceae bacterium]